MTAAFGALWPNIHGMLRILKRRFDYKIISRLLQRGESLIMIDGVCQRITRELPHVPYLTIHDSILVTPGFWEQVERQIVGEFLRYGVGVTVRRKPRRK